jgi:ATP-dependent 26S proteasome regulatory subunit
MVPPPGTVETERLLQLTLSGIKVSSSVDWKSLVEELKGSSAAYVVKAAQDAAKAAVLVGRKTVEETDLRRAIAEICKGRSTHT